jgi:4-aminobutyrate aminotransferase-like enzyme/Ser/Thr protein kinase RdoA (MazF antagonist)
MEFNPVSFAAEAYGLTVASCHELPGEVDRNYRLATAAGEQYVLKIAHGDPAHVDLQVQALLHLKRRATPLRLAQPVADRGGLYWREVPEAGAGAVVRLQTWVPGTLWADFQPHSPALLASLGRAAGRLCRDLADFDHPAAHRFLKWDPARLDWTAEHLHLLEGTGLADAARFFLDRFQAQATLFERLRRSVNYNDCNDYNLLVGDDPADPAVTGIIDFGDMVHTWTACEPAVACAYAMLDRPDPLAAAATVVGGFHEAFPLREEELAVLFTLIGARLVLTVTVAALNQRDHPANAYLQVSARPARELLLRLAELPPELVHAVFRTACGLEPSPSAGRFRRWLERHRHHLAAVVRTDLSRPPVLDLGVGSTELGLPEIYQDAGHFQHWVEQRAVDSCALGRYLEARPIYTSEDFRVEGNEGPEWRTVHLGLDVFLPAGTPVHAPWRGRVHHVGAHPADRDWGGLVILEHPAGRGFSFWTLYGHLDPASLAGLQAGQPVRKGQRIGRLGARPANGNWPPHLHFQVLLNPLGLGGDFPGVARPSQRAIWAGLCPDPAPLLGVTVPPPDHLSDEEILNQRRQHLGRSLSVSYRRPIHMVRGSMQYLYDADGRRYLDTVNNVPHVGHQHPRVVRAACRQAAVLNTNTRYLHEEIVGFARELCATLPPQLSVCHFVNSGSEANELALRMARAFTGRRDMVVVAAGYHGNTTGCIDISSYKFNGPGGSGAPAHVQVVAMPDPYRGRFREDDPAAGWKYADLVGEAVGRIRRAGRGVAGFICESILSCGGQIVPPPGYLARAFRHVREAGGVCIADEVQVGFGRVGDAFWAFELQGEGAAPDILTLGKPIGNGHPLGAVVTTPAIAAAFANGMEYFNTFGGNPVSCAVGREVLRIIREENLQAHALRMGRRLLDGLRELQREYPVIGDVRGHGLFLGFELVTDPARRIPAPAHAAYLANRMRELGILMSTDGPDHNVIKIKPPLPFDDGDAAFLLDTLRRVLRENAMRTV